MDAGHIFAVYTTSMFVAGVIAAIASRLKRRHPIFWTVASLLVPPMVVLLLLLPRGRSAPLRMECDDDDVERINASDNLDHWRW